VCSSDLEAVATGRQVIYYNPHGEDFGLLSSDETGTIIYAKNQQELKGAIIEAINRQDNTSINDRRKSFLLDHIGTNNHDATELCQNEIENIVEQNRLSYKHLYNLYIDTLRMGSESKKALDDKKNIKKRLLMKINDIVRNY
jgi:hypothetical protein